MLELYHSGTSVCAAKVRLALAEKGLDWTGHYLDILAGDQLDPTYLALNPKGVVPTLVHDGAVVIESTVICEYIDDAFPETPLRPADAAGRAEMRLWTKQVDEALHVAIADITFVVSHRHSVLAKGEENTRRFIDDAPDTFSRDRRASWIYEGVEAPGVRAAVALYAKTLSAMNAVLADRAWLAGEVFSLADIGLLPYVNRLRMLNMSAMWEPNLPHIGNWLSRCRDRASFYPGVEKHVPDNSRDALLRDGHAGGPELLDACGII